MKNPSFEIVPDYRFKTNVKYVFFLIGLIFITMPIINSGNDAYYFFGFIILILGLFFTLFSSKQCLKINEELIEFESKSIINGFNESISIRFDTIIKVNFYKRQFLIFGGRSYIADADAQKLYHENRMVFHLKNKEYKTITQTGKLEEFKMAYNLIKNKVDLRKT